MKNIYLTISLILLSIVTIQAQFTVATHDGDPITDGSIFTFSALGEEHAALGLVITNTSTGIIDMRLEYVSITNGDDLGDWICIFGGCLPPPNVTVGDILPLGGTNDWTTLAPGETTFERNDHFYNTDVGDGVNYPIEYVFRFFEVDINGNEIGDSITFTYRYDGTASIEDMAQVGYKLYPSVSSDFVNLVVNESVSARMFNTQGQFVKEYDFVSGSHIIDVSSLSSQLYYLILSNKQGQQSLAKIVVK